MFYSAEKNGFYDDKIHKNIPDDVIEISKERHLELLAAQSRGNIICPDNKGNPIIKESVYHELIGSEYVVSDENLTAYKHRIRTSIEKEFNQKCKKSYSYDGKMFQVCKDSQNDIQKKALYAITSISNPDLFPWDSENDGEWKCTDNSYHDFVTAGDFLIFAKAVNGHVGNCTNGLMRKMFRKKDEIDLLTTYEEVRDYDITLNW